MNMATSTPVPTGLGESRTSKATERMKMQARGVKVHYGDNEALHCVDVDIFENEVVAFIGPSGYNKSTFLRCLNRMNDTIPGCRVEGEVSLEGQDIYAPSLDVVLLRAQVGIVFQKPNPFPKTIYEDRKSTRLNSSHVRISYAVFCLKKKINSP